MLQSSTRTHIQHKMHPAGDTSNFLIITSRTLTYQLFPQLMTVQHSCSSFFDLHNPSTKYINLWLDRTGIRTTNPTAYTQFKKTSLVCQPFCKKTTEPSKHTHSSTWIYCTIPATKLAVLCTQNEALHTCFSMSICAEH